MLLLTTTDIYCKYSTAVQATDCNFQLLSTPTTKTDVIKPPSQ